jgi:hypothetical protein
VGISIRDTGKVKRQKKNPSPPSRYQKENITSPTQPISHYWLVLEAQLSNQKHVQHFLRSLSVSGEGKTSPISRFLFQDCHCHCHCHCCYRNLVSASNDRSVQRTEIIRVPLLPGPSMGV